MPSRTSSRSRRRCPRGVAKSRGRISRGPNKGLRRCKSKPGPKAASQKPRSRRSRRSASRSRSRCPKGVRKSGPVIASGPNAGKRHCRKSRRSRSRSAAPKRSMTVEQAAEAAKKLIKDAKDNEERKMKKHVKAAEMKLAKVQRKQVVRRNAAARKVKAAENKVASANKALGVAREAQRKVAVDTGDKLRLALQHYRELKNHPLNCKAVEPANQKGYKKFKCDDEQNNAANLIARMVKARAARDSTPQADPDAEANLNAAGYRRYFH